MRALTDFADQAVVLPLAAMIALSLLLAARTAAAAAFGVGLAALDGAIGLAKILGQCAPGGFLGSPSGHVASAAYVWGCGLGLVLGLRRTALLAGACGLALAIGVTRVELEQHTVFEVVVGALAGLLVASFVARQTGAYRRPPRYAVGLLALPLLLHGTHLDAEPVLQHMGHQWLSVCETYL